jgi:hypothetical protein
MKVRVTIILTALIALGVTGCASKPNTFANADPTVDFSQYRTFSYYENLSTDEAQYQSLVSNFLKVAVAQEMYKRGLVHEPENPELLVNFYIHTKDKIKTRSVPTAGVGYGGGYGGGYYGYRDPFYDSWGGYGGYETRVDQYTEGTLNIDVVDASTKKLIWEGSIAGRLTDKDVRNMEQTIDEAVGVVMTAFPVVPGSVQ